MSNFIFTATDDSQKTANKKITIIFSMLLLFVCWVTVRAVFFTGLYGFDDLYYIRYALMWDRLPADHWEARILFNFLLRICFSIFGYNEFVSTLPTLLASLVFMFSVFYVALQFWNIPYAFFAALLAVILPLDVTSSTSLGILTLANMFAALGTACILTAKKDWQLIIAGCFFGLSIFTHLTLIFYVGVFALVLWGYKWPEFQWKKSMVVIGTSLMVLILINVISFYWITGDPLYQLKLLSRTKITVLIPMYLESGSINPYWLIWPIQNLIISKEFGLLFIFSVIFGLFYWETQSAIIRLLCLIIIFYWVWINYGTVNPMKYIPLDHTTRYWLPVALPACILATQVLTELKGKISRSVYLLATVALPLVGLAASGPWGQNIDITKELMAYTKKHSDTKYVTDRYTLDEMFILNGAKPPENIFSIKKFKQPGFFNISEEYQLVPTDSNIVFLYNEQNMWRPFAFEYKEYIVKNVKLTEISKKEYRLLTYCLPKSIRAKFNWMVKKPAAKIGKLNI